MKNQVIPIDKEKILAGSEKYFWKMCGTPMNEEAEELREKFEIWLLPQIIVSIDSGNGAEEVCTYAMCIEELERDGLDMLEQFYLDTWMTAILDSTRDWLKQYLCEYLSKEKGQQVFLSEAFGPGFYGIGMDEIPKILEKMDGSRIGVNWNGACLYPPKSNVGYYLVFEEEQEWRSRDCKNCLSGHKNCIFCKNYLPFA